MTRRYIRVCLLYPLSGKLAAAHGLPAKGLPPKEGEAMTRAGWTKWLPWSRGPYRPEFEVRLWTHNGDYRKARR